MLLGRLAACGSLLLSLAFAADAFGQATPRTYDYGGASGGGGEYEGKAGFLVFLEAGLANPRNADNVVATRLGSVISPIIPSWDDDFAGRAGLGYQWPSGNRFYGQAWTYSTETQAADTGGLFALPIGPGFSGTGDGFAISTELEATSADLIFARRQPLSDHFEAQWSVGLRYAHFEEVSEGAYSEFGTLLRAAKSNEADMVGARGGLRGAWQWGHFVLEIGGALSLLDGEVTGVSSLTPVVGGGATSLVVADDGRSGTIQELDVLLGWRSSSDSWFFGGGWEEQVWEGLTTDLVRHYPNAVVPPRDRDSIAFSAYKVVVSFIF